jgi:L-ribulokinase
MPNYAIGLDFGTNSCRSLIVDLADGREVASHVFDYPSGQQGILVDESDPNLARQDPQDHLDGLVAIVTEAIRMARDVDTDFTPDSIMGIGVDTTGSTPLPMDKNGTPLALLPEYRNDPNAAAWLWKDHTAHAEAALITARAATLRPQYLAKCGGTYSSEWFWAKVLHCKNCAPAVFEAAHSFVEHCDYIPALLAGNTRADAIVRSVCAAGHKAMYSDQWGGLPDREFLAEVDPALVPLRDRLYDSAVSSDHVAGTLCAEWAETLGLRMGTPIAVGAFDAHMGAVGAGIREGVLVKILGTSTCDMMVRSRDRNLADIPGVCGIVEGSILPDYFGIEAGQSAVGDIFLWFVNNHVPDSYGKTADEKFAGMAEAAAPLKPGEHGLLALDWNNGNRCILVDVRLTGLMLGQTLHTTPHEIYRALVEATAFGALRIIERLEEFGVPIHEIVNCGGLAVKNKMLMQIYADITGRPMKISKSDQTCALGAALFGAVAAGKEAGGFATVDEAQSAMSHLREKVFEPIPENQQVYAELYALYKDLHDAFGTQDGEARLYPIMKRLIDIREKQRSD